ncbi:hypothetical protein H3S74_03965 [Gilliamella sp. W8126]|uniref:hypothetical protein n=1 Tax=Gilliamella sp. W8126 TaxID=2750946 RepID=UPI0018DB4AA2|nr:hypothetical protein [Gilliamella sp. W8126]MBI0005388.1 hypothetical protein [Gilliamella sp. W8126]
MSGKNTASALKANDDGRQLRKPSLLGCNRRIEIAIKQQNVRNRSNKKFEERDF